MDRNSRMGGTLARVFIVAFVLIFCTSWFHFLYIIGKVEFVYSYLYYIPIIIAAFFFGIAGGLIVSVISAFAYSIFVAASGAPYGAGEFLPAAGSFIVIGLGTGILSSRLVNSRQELAEKVSQLSISAEIGLAVTSTLDPRDALEIVMKKTVKAVSCEIGSILLFDPENNLLTIEASHGIDEQIVKNTKLKVGERISGWVVQHGEPVMVNDVEKDPRFAKRSSEKYYTKSLLSVPLKIRGETIGVLNVNNKKTKKGFTESDLSLLKGLASQVAVAIRNARLYRKVNEAYMNSIKALAAAIEEKDNYTRSHSENVTRYAVAIAEEMGLSIKQIEKVREAAQLHDLGKIGIHDYILNKPGKLTEEEWVEVKMHSLKGARILEPLSFLNGVIEIIKQHHERYDGKGYPNGQMGNEIHLGARIMAVADAYDAMTSERPYRKAMSREEAVEELKRENGKQFAPNVVEAFLRLFEGNKI